MSKNSQGFTIIELVASVFIIIIISGIFIVNYHGSNKRSELTITGQKLASDIRLAQNYSLGLKTYNAGNIPEGGWGVHFDATDHNKYLIFADKDANHIFDAGSDEAMETKTLPLGITIDSIFVDNQPETYVDIVFFPPDPETYIHTLAATSNSSTARVVLKENINGSKVTTTINFFGLIDTE